MKSHKNRCLKTAQGEDDFQLKPPGPMDPMEPLDLQVIFFGPNGVRTLGPLDQQLILKDRHGRDRIGSGAESFWRS